MLCQRGAEGGDQRGRAAYPDQRDEDGEQTIAGLEQQQAQSRVWLTQLIISARPPPTRSTSQPKASDPRTRARHDGDEQCGLPRCRAPAHRQLGTMCVEMIVPPVAIAAAAIVIFK